MRMFLVFSTLHSLLCCEIRFGPTIVSAIVAVTAFLPAALSHGIGSEIQRPLARVVIGGLISSTALTLLALPAVYALFAGRREVPPPPSGARRRRDERLVSPAGWCS